MTTRHAADSRNAHGAPGSSRPTNSIVLLHIGIMCYLPGSEGDGVANVLAGKVPFSGKLPMPYYSSVEDIRTDRVKFELGYGLTAE